LLFCVPFPATLSRFLSFCYLSFRPVSIFLLFVVYSSSRCSNNTACS
jgi:hypothetical protein